MIPHCCPQARRRISPCCLPISRCSVSFETLEIADGLLFSILLAGSSAALDTDPLLSPCRACIVSIMQLLRMAPNVKDLVAGLSSRRNEDIVRDEDGRFRVTAWFDADSAVASLAPSLVSVGESAR